MTATKIELVHVSPNDLALEDNVRTDTALGKEFLASVKENGVLVPVVAVRGEDGALKVRMGQRRTLAAQEAGIESIPVYVTDEDDDTATRLIEQIIENDHRLALNETDRVVAYQQLLDTGLSATKIAKRLSVSMDKVKKAGIIAKSETAMEVLQQATLEEAAAIAEFEDRPEDLAELKRDMGTRYFTHTVERLRQQREFAKKYAIVAKPYKTAGYLVLDEVPRWNTSYVPLDQLTNPDGSALEGPTDQPELWAVYVDDNEVFVDKETNEQVDERDIDWSTEGKPDAESAEGKRHAESVEESIAYEPLWFCIDPAAAGLTVSERFANIAARQADAKTAVEDPEAQAARIAAEKEERRQTITLNKAADAAETVRREFVTNLLKRKTAPKGTAQFVATMLAKDSFLLANYKADKASTELLGVASGVKSEILNQLEDATPARAEVITLGLVLGALESRLARDAWRSGKLIAERGPFGVGPVDYLGFLEANGYGLSQVEQVMVGHMTVEDCYSQLTHSS